MMFRIKYLLGIIAGIFGLLYSTIALVGWNDVFTLLDRYMAVLLAAIHILISITFFILSYRDHKKEVRRMEEVIASLLAYYPSLSVKEIAEAASVSEGEMQDYLRSAAHTKNVVVVQSDDMRNIRVFAAHTLN